MPGFVAPGPTQPMESNRIPSTGPANMHPDSLDLAPELIQQRLRWAREQGHPFYLWPDMPVGEWRASLREIERVTTHILANGSPPVLALPPLAKPLSRPNRELRARSGIPLL